MYYNYMEAMKEDVTRAISEYEYQYEGLSREDLEEKLNDDLWIDDSVTGNGSGSYTCNAAEARDMVQADGEEYYQEAVEEFCIDSETVAEHLFDYEYIDVTTRCYLLGQAISEALDDLEADGFFEDEEEEGVLCKER